MFFKCFNRHLKTCFFIIIDFQRNRERTERDRDKNINVRHINLLPAKQAPNFKFIYSHLLLWWDLVCQRSQYLILPQLQSFSLHMNLSAHSIPSPSTGIPLLGTLCLCHLVTQWLLLSDGFQKNFELAEYLTFCVVISEAVSFQLAISYTLAKSLITLV